MEETRRGEERREERFPHLIGHSSPAERPLAGKYLFRPNSLKSSDISVLLLDFRAFLRRLRVFGWVISLKVKGNAAQIF